MSNRRSIEVVVIAALLFGYCGRGYAQPALTVVCPQSQTNCTQSNGAGVYTAEGGSAEISFTHLMITAFVNHPDRSSVTFHGRYKELAGPMWLTLEGTVDSADYQDDTLETGLAVVAVTEQATTPTWTLRNEHTGITRAVTDDNLLRLRIHIAFTPVSLQTLVTEFPEFQHYLTVPVRIVLDFDDAVPQVTPNRAVIHTYNMRWHDETTLRGAPASPQQYCLRPNGVSALRPNGVGADINDQVVFQQGILVDPVTGSVARSPNAVTMSCYYGAPATVYGWGYDYRGNRAHDFYFAAGIHMKRASYCGDFQHYTLAGTKISIVDDVRINGRRRVWEPAQLEALWSPGGAVCVNPERLRHKDLIHNSDYNVCNGRRLPLCAYYIAQHSINLNDVSARGARLQYLGDSP